MQSSFQIPTVPVTLRAIMRNADFQRGVADVRCGRSYPADFDAGARGGVRGSVSGRQWEYERGRQWAVAAGPDVYLLDGRGEPTAEAMAIYQRAGIL